MKTTRTSRLVSSLLACALASAFAAGCSVDTTGTTVDENVGENRGMSFEEFLATVEVEEGTGAFIVDHDIVLHSMEALRDYHAQMEQPGALAVYNVGGVDQKWSDAAKLNISYCVSTTFGANYAAVVQAMNNATAAWEKAANVNFVYQSDQDASCGPANANVVFDVRPTSGQPYLARAFFPNYARSSRNVLIDSSSFGNLGVWTLTGILRHELGHALGYRHEHTRAPTGCYEDNQWRGLTPYDSASVMHYPHCSGSQTGDLVLTDHDKNGNASLYAPALTSTWGGSGFSIATSNVKINGGSNKATLSPGAAFTLGMTYTIKTPFCPGCIDQIMVGFAGSGASGCTYNGVPGAAGVTQTSSIVMTAPITPGTYYVRYKGTLEYSCNMNAWTGSPPNADSNIAVVVVQ